ncbi:hypothetical protein GP486_007292 [Trichoglossum hirsutum]|uniref:ZZ-type domain-containing protein n=1 Tax=Trichoglossum hirsutum TaxID=265104 RepID=A0A9P8IC17_9PEZI|nr:hypothetical protein GP486_007292 [Trichoglossum hirsutum]
MPSTLACLPIPLPSSSRRSVPQSSSITTAPNLRWRRIGAARDHLLSELQKMYWNGVNREMAHILLTLGKWQQPEFASVVLRDESDDFIHGFDTFTDQVSETARDFAARYEARMELWKKGERLSYAQALLERSKDFQADKKSIALKVAVRESLAGFLDIDKLIVYRPPEENLTFWKRPVAPQLSLIQYDNSCMPLFGPKTCYICRGVVRGCMFKSIGQDAGVTICEDCYRQHHYGDDRFLKVYKHCILRDSVDREHSRRICHCSTVPHIDSDGRSRSLFPVDEKDQHRGAKSKAMRCGLLNLNTLVAEAKYQGMLSEHEKHTDLSEQKRIIKAEEQKRRDLEAAKKRMGTALKVTQQASLIDPSNRTAAAGMSAALEEDEADEDVPFFLRKFANRYPFGNIHMALRVGPLIIENGVEQYVTVSPSPRKEKKSTNFKIIAPAGEL